MGDIHNIKIYTARFSNTKQKVLTELFDISTIKGVWFIGLSTNDGEIEMNLSNLAEYHSYGFFEFDKIPDMFHKEVNVFKSFIGLDGSVDDAVNLLLDNESFPEVEGFNFSEYCDRNYYLKTIINYKMNQEGRPQNSFKVKLINSFEFSIECCDDVISIDGLSEADDFECSELTIKTYLTEQQFKKKYKFYLHER